MGGDSAAADAETLLGGGFHIYVRRVRAQGRRQGGSHSANMRRKLRLFGDNRAVGVHQNKAGAQNLLVAQAEQLKAVRTFVFRVAVRKMAAYVRQTYGAEKRIRKRMTKSVRVGVPEQPLRVRNFHPAEHQPPPGGEAVNVVAVTYSKHSSEAPFKNASAMSTSSGEVIFMFFRLPRVKNTRRPSFSKTRLSSVQSESSRKARSMAER